ncbi:MAG: hypothetical protein PHG02_00650 [Oscillospiraceae bacterium]|nr:hypothetical protein [Oscillospiraceae bacterium]
MSMETRPQPTPTRSRSCDVKAYSLCEVSVPVTVTPYAKIGTIKSKCCGKPIIVCDEKPPKGKVNGSCSFTITQKICVEIPVEFGTETRTAEAYVACLGASEKDLCDFHDDFPCNCEE